MKLEVKNLFGGYGKTNIIKDISFSVDSGDILCIMGQNGSGKSTIFNFLLRFLTPSKGEILLNNKPIESYSTKEYAKCIAYIPQYHNTVFGYSVLDIVMMGRTPHLTSLDSPSDEDIKKSYDTLELLGISHMAHRNYKELSGGERQLVLIARSICQDAKLLIMDEPTANLDYANQRIILETIQKLSDSGYTTIMSTHSTDHPFQVSNKVLLIKNGRCLGFGDTSDILTESSLETIYGIPMDIFSVSDRNGNIRNICLPLSS